MDRHRKIVGCHGNANCEWTFEYTLGKQLGYSVHLTDGDGAAALSALVDGDTLVTGLRLEKLDALELIRAARAKFPSMPIFVWTGSPDHLELESARKAGATEVFRMCELSAEETARRISKIVEERYGVEVAAPARSLVAATV